MRNGSGVGTACHFQPPCPCVPVCILTSSQGARSPRAAEQKSPSVTECVCIWRVCTSAAPLEEIQIMKIKNPILLSLAVVRTVTDEVGGGMLL